MSAANGKGKPASSKNKNSNTSGKNKSAKNASKKPQSSGSSNGIGNSNQALLQPSGNRNKQQSLQAFTSLPLTECDNQTAAFGDLSLGYSSLTGPESSDFSRASPSLGRSSRLPIYTKNGTMAHHSPLHRPRNPQNANCQIHGLPSSPRSHLVPYDVRMQHDAHVCVHQAPNGHRSAPGSIRGTPLPSGPSTPTSSRRPSAAATNSSNKVYAKHSSLQASQVSTAFTVNSRRSKATPFDEYMPLCEIQKSLKKGEVVEGLLRINPRNYEDAYISAPDGGMDIYVAGTNDRNRALHGDRVAVLLYGQSKWKILYDSIRTNWHEWKDQMIVTTTVDQNVENVCAQPEASSDVRVEEDLAENVKLMSIQEELPGKEVPAKETNENGATPVAVSGGEEKESKKPRRRQKKKKHPNVKATKKSTEPDCPEKDDPAPVNESVVESVQPKVASPKKVKTKAVATSAPRTPKKMQLPAEISGWSAEDFLKQPFGALCIQKTGKVVQIMESNHLRLAGGKLRLQDSPSSNFAIFSPHDSRIPRIVIPMHQCPHDFLLHPHYYANSLFMAKIVDWPMTSPLPVGQMQQFIGNPGDVEAETKMILLENQVDDTEFPDEAYIGIPGVEDSTPWIIPEAEIKARRDFRKETVFTIDPATARDLDDALSVRKLDEVLDGKQMYEVGVHIADVSHFLREDMPLDEIARVRTTSVYLVQRVIPMLPRILCEKHCSLTPGEDKLTFSVVWKMDEDGFVHDEWFGRTVINSCVKLSYDHAQDMINDSSKEWSADELPQIFGEKATSDISWCVNKLMDFSRAIRKRRFDAGSLRLDKLKLGFVLDPETGLASGFHSYRSKESNYLVEEFMLMANMAVAHKIHTAYPELAFLRNHPAPDDKLLKDFMKFCEHNNFEVDCTSSTTLQKSLSVFTDGNPIISLVVSHFLLRSMKNATYFCSGVISSPTDFHHYALNVPLYTHFTSPIRRYPDVVVHRLLAAALSYRPLLKDSARDLHRLAGHCNGRKLAARLVSEASSKLFLGLYIREAKPTEEAIVLQVFDHSFDVLVIKYGQNCRVYMDKLDLKRFSYQVVRGVPSLKLTWNEKQTDFGDADEVVQEIRACTVVIVQVHVADEDVFKWTGTMQHPSHKNETD